MTMPRSELKTYRDYHWAQQKGWVPNVGNSPFGFYWHDLPSLARQQPDVEVVPQQQQQQQDSEGEDSNNQEQQQDSEEGNSNNNNNQEQQQDSEGEDSNNQQQQQQDSEDSDSESKGDENGNDDDDSDNFADPDVDTSNSHGQKNKPDGDSTRGNEDDPETEGVDEDAVPSADSVDGLDDDEDVPTNLQPMGQVDGEASGEEDGEVDAYDTGDGEDGDGDSLSPIVGDWDYADSLPNVGKHGGYVHEQAIPTPSDAARLMKRALSKLSGGFATGMTPLWDYAKLVRRVATRQDYNLAKKEQDGNPTVLFIGDTSGSCANMIAEMKAILMTATSMGVRGSDVWLLLASNANVTWGEIDSRKRYSGYGRDELALYQNGKEMPIENYMGNRDECVWYENIIGNIIDAINPKVVVNVGDIDSYGVMLHMLGKRNVRTLHVYAPNRGGLRTEDGLPLTYPIAQSTPIHPYVNMIRASTTIPTSGTVNVAMVGQENRRDKNKPPLSWRIAYAVDFFFSPEKMSQLPIVTFYRV